MINQSILSDHGELLRTGYTTGSCATAAATAAIRILMEKADAHSLEEQSIVLPNGFNMIIPVDQVRWNPDDSVTAVVTKDSGDDQDVTHGLEIHATVRMTPKPGAIEIIGGEGVGTVTREGLQTPVGSWAINPTPLMMIRDNVSPFISENEGVEIKIVVPRGREIAKKTFNGRLGILGGISIIGTSGIVRPMSEDAFKDSIYLELKQKYALGVRQLYLVPGMHGEKFAQSQFGADSNTVVHMSNFIGFSIRAAEKIGFEKLIIVGHIGKLIKVAGGIFNTHSKVADGKAHIAAAHLALMKAPYELIEAVYHANTTDEMSDILYETPYKGVFMTIACEAKKKCISHLDFMQEIEIVLYDMKGRLLAMTDVETEEANQ